MELCHDLSCLASFTERDIFRWQSFDQTRGSAVTVCIPVGSSISITFLGGEPHRVTCGILVPWPGTEPPGPFIYLAALSLSCGMLDPRCGTWAPECLGPGVHRLSCSMAHGILVSWPEIEPKSPELQGGFLTTGPPGKSLYILLYLNLPTPPCPSPLLPSELVPSSLLLLLLNCFSHVWLCATDHSPPGSSVQGILQARILEWVAMRSSRGSSWARDRIRISYLSCIGSRVLYH